MPRLQRATPPHESDSSSSEGDEGLNGHLQSISASFKSLRKENVRLRRQIEKLNGDIEVLHASAQTPSRKTSASKIKNLERELGSAKKEVTKYKNKYEKLRADELKREKHELDDPFGGAPAIDERYQQMKTLLRNFRALIEEVTLEDRDEKGNYPECPICYEALEKDTAVAFPCEHIFHKACVRQLVKHARDSGKNLVCPTCRKESELDELLDITRTAGEQWQELTDIATAWANLDMVRDEADTVVSDGTSAPSFIENDLESAEEEDVQDVQDVQEDPQDDERKSPSEEDTTPRTPTRSQKRRRLEDLAASRSAKKQRRDRQERLPLASLDDE